jgi:hypothetical protein
MYCCRVRFRVSLVCLGFRPSQIRCLFSLQFVFSRFSSVRFLRTRIQARSMQNATAATELREPMMAETLTGEVSEDADFVDSVGVGRVVAELVVV